MFVELVYDKRNFDGLPGAKDIILGELARRVHRIFPDADVRVKPMMTLPAINTDASKHEKEQISRVLFRKCLKRLICGWFQIKRLEPSYCLSTIRRDWPSFNTRTIERSPVGRSHALAYGVAAATANLSY